MGQVEFIEDVTDRPVDPDNVPSDQDLIDNGLVPVRAFIRTKSSKNALRVKRARAKAEAGEVGPARRQLNIAAPPDEASRAALKAAASALLDGSITAEGLTQFVTGRIQNDSVHSDQSADHPGTEAAAILQQNGWRSFLIRLLIRR